MQMSTRRKYSVWQDRVFVLPVLFQNCTISSIALQIGTGLTVKVEIILTWGCPNLQIHSKLVQIYACIYDHMSHVIVVQCSGSEFWV